MADSTCTIDGCGRPYLARGWCNKHYLRWYIHGDPLVGPPETLAERFWSKVDRSGQDDCWEWLASRTAKGYGQFHAGDGTRAMRRAHRVAYELEIGPVPQDLVLDHLCRNPACVNPSHLEPVTPRENTLRGVGITAIQAQQTQCIHGHEFTPENTRIRPDGSRICQTCRREVSRRHKAKLGRHKRGKR